MRPKRLVFLTDEHFPLTIPAYYDNARPKRPSPLFNFLRDFDPHVIVQGGDQLDLEEISHWNKGKPRIKEGKRLAETYKRYNQLLDVRQQPLKSLEKWVMLEGNHERWIQYLIDEQPELLEGLIEVPQLLNLKARGCQWVPNRKFWKYGRLHFIHGDYKNGYAPVYHARSIAQIYNKNIIYGHFHTNQSYVSVTPFDTHPHQVNCVGTLGGVNPLWKRNEPSAWINSFWVSYHYPDGNYCGYTVNIINGKFTFDGQTYS